jgi:hypothetical protein
MEESRKFCPSFVPFEVFGEFETKREENEFALNSLFDHNPATGERPDSTVSPQAFFPPGG